MGLKARQPQATHTVTDAAPFKIRPCIKVDATLRVDRAVNYQRKDLSEEVHDDGSETAKWETERFYKNREEAKDADRVYAKARQRLRSVCLFTDIGFVCPMTRAKELDLAIAEAHKLVLEANQRYDHCHIHMRIVRTPIEVGNVDGAEVLRDTLVTSVSEIRDALATFDFKKARDVLNATKQMTEILGDPEAKKQLVETREEARDLASEIAYLVKDFDGHVKDAMASAQGDQLLSRAKAVWNF